MEIIFKELTNAFNDISIPFGASSNAFASPMPQGYYPDNPGFVEQLDHVKHLQVGEGSDTIKIDRQGLWTGDKDFALAPYRSDMLGTQIWNDGSNDRMIIGLLTTV